MLPVFLLHKSGGRVTMSVKESLPTQKDPHTWVAGTQLEAEMGAEEEAFIDMIFPVEVVENNVQEKTCGCWMKPFNPGDSDS
jgi:hypothetical protein